MFLMNLIFNPVSSGFVGIRGKPSGFSGGGRNSAIINHGAARKAALREDECPVVNSCRTPRRSGEISGRRGSDRSRPRSVW